MRKPTHVAFALAVLAGAGWLLLSDRSSAADDDKANPAVADGLLKIADALAKDDEDGAKKQAAALSKKVDELHDVMHMFKPRAKKGFGVGAKKDNITPDGIEDMIRGLARDVPSQAKVNKQAAALERMGYITAAMMEVAMALPPEKFELKQTKKLWMETATASRDAGIELAKAARDKSPAALKTAASRANNGCVNCHAEFRSN